ncbi:hypothetical protein Tco_1362160 [Tanacetum coccineum]
MIADTLSLTPPSKTPFVAYFIDGGELVDVPSNVAKFLCDKAKGLMSTTAFRVVTRGHETQLLDVAKLSELCIVRFNGLGQAEIVDDKLDDSDEKTNAAKARRAQEENKGSPRRCPNISFTNRLRAMDDRLGEIDSHIYKMGGEVEELTMVVLGIFEQYDQFYGVQHGVNFMNNPQTYSTVPSTTYANLFGPFDNPRDVPSTSRHPQSDMDEE